MFRFCGLTAAGGSFARARGRGAIRSAEHQRSGPEKINSLSGIDIRHKRPVYTCAGKTRHDERTKHLFFYFLLAKDKNSYR
ncbi:unnamed protein product [Hermetia illucens]|uniref:Uncharacterized protein n=1 Tax=Hermetia illucens TaxID=343691 RepID=A0A7R8UF18_HERIL|nr:unnamed protein product [Hermetia illucens]